jgi:hypothetical protein
MRILNFETPARKKPSVENAKEAVRATSHSGLLGAASGIPVSLASLPGALGRYSFKVKRDKAGRVIGASDRKIELDPGKHSNALELGVTLAHELKHAEDELSGEFGNFQESDRPRLESRAESVERKVAAELAGRERAA